MESYFSTLEKYIRQVFILRLFQIGMAMLKSALWLEFLNLLPD